MNKTYLINLDTRLDRLESFVKVHPEIDFTRISAVNGKTIQMTDALYQLCRNNTFQWKKSVIACALSHISVWSKIVKDNATYTLILEDDMRFKPNWKQFVKDIPPQCGVELAANKPTNPCPVFDLCGDVCALNSPKIDLDKEGLGAYKNQVREKCGCPP